MGLFVEYMYTFVKEFNDVNGIVTRKKASEWFQNKKAIRRNGYKDQMILENKSAVVVVGVSCIGKSTYVQKFLKQFPSFKHISYDEACYQKVDEIKDGAQDKECRIVEILEEQMLKAQNVNIIVDAMCINLASRAALLRFLKDLGYEIHLIYFSQAYTEANINKCIVNRAIEITLYQDYLATHNTSKMYMRDIMKIRGDILAIYARKRGITIQELMTQTLSLPETMKNTVSLVSFYDNEVKENRMWWQEKRELFLLGADYYYEL